MKQTETSFGRWLVVAIYAMAMAWVESAVVFYLRTMIDRIDPYQPNPLPMVGGFAKAELIRELATMVMLATVGILAGKNLRSRFGYFVVAFGIWDIFYYVFLVVMTGWPGSLMDWDLLFLIPLPWWGPVWAPVAISILMIVWGTLACRLDSSAKLPGFSWKTWGTAGAGALIALYAFTKDAIDVAIAGGSLRKLLPVTFDTELFCFGLILMSVPVVEILFVSYRREKKSEGTIDYTKWITHFRRNRENRTEPDWTAPLSIPTEVLAPLRASIEEFQLGDGGGPAGLIAFDASRFRDRNGGMRAVVDAWFAEEREHARLLGGAVDRLGGTKITNHWSFSAFCWVRRSLGVRFELQVLLLTELVSTAYYRVLKRHVPDAPIVAMCQLIMRDEAGHVAFHRDRLAADGCNPSGVFGALWEMQFWFFGHAAATVLWSSHGRCLGAIGGSRAEYFAEVRYELARFVRSLSCETEPYAVLAVMGK